ncbi:hypothetical protein QQM39_08340 [Streptomyces sp. DT2A-34]|uniref:hypothetical protein n=1 Tax=Streptomyces sp. DT2A-34 TaxID=3051182 RepID=UPI00265BADBE|nr:hypothetical protein [Streptomyces sp. DT2A-34]MDO0910859.1 hypothetical protein [Streptomyces sp. DT2A-34]
MCPNGTLWQAAPAKVLRELTADEIAWKGNGTLQYQKLAQRCLTALHPAEPATERASDAAPAHSGEPEHITLHEYRTR